MLRLNEITAGYGDLTVLRKVDFSINEGEVVALLGSNGAGKTTLLRAATGLIRPWAGSIEINGRDVARRSADVFVAEGVCHIPEGRGIFPSLTVMENLVLQSRSRKPADAVSEIAEIFPVLAKRLKQTAGSMSGGEQQMLALSRAYLTRPKVVFVDEPSLGLAPIIVEKIYDALTGFVKQGMALVLVEQYVQKALHLAQRVYIMNRGQMIFEGRKDEVGADEIYARYLGLNT